MAREWLRPLLLTAALALLAVGSEAQGRRGRGGRAGRAGAGRANRGAASAPAAPKPERSEPLPPLTIPGFPSATGAKGAKQPAQPAAGRNPKAGAKTPAKEPTKAAKPLDPMKAADLVTAAADHAAAQDEANALLAREHFGVCDLDGNGWLSLRETEVTLALTRDEYRRADANQDGRLDLAEFEGEQELVLARLGARPPLAKPETTPEPLRGPLADPLPASSAPSLPPAARAQATNKRRAARSDSAFGKLLVRPVDLLRRYDLDHSKGIGTTEIEKLFNELGLAFSAEMVMAQMDPNASGELGLRELTPLAWLASKNLPESLRPDSAPTGEPEPASESVSPPRTHFDLLDPGHDEFIDEADLRALQANVRLEVRLRAVLSALDGDGDGRLSEAEFRASMRRVAD